MNQRRLWIEGNSRSGKTSRLVKEFSLWVKERLNFPANLSSSALVLSANDDNRRELREKLSIAIQGTHPVMAKTPLGFISDEIILFWPIVFDSLNLKAQFPIRLRPETEQELATKLWRPEITPEDIQHFGSEYFFVRRLLDLLQLAGASTTPLEGLETILQEVLPEYEDWGKMMSLLAIWQQWSTERGLLSYGITYDLYWKYLLPDAGYRKQLARRYQAVFADDLDDYPAIARELLEVLLELGCSSVFTYNPQGKIRLGLNADPDYLKGLANRCEQEYLDSDSGLGQSTVEIVLQLISDPLFIDIPPSGIVCIQGISRSQVLEKTATVVKEMVQEGTPPEAIALIAPGLDEIARYTLIKSLSQNHIPVQAINEQRPLISSPLVRALLTLMLFIYPGLGYGLQPEHVAEMLVVLGGDIDPVRGGLVADNCLQLHPNHPQLLPLEVFPRWDRIGHQAAIAYQEIIQWVESCKGLQIKGNLPPAIFLDLAIKRFFPTPTLEQLTSLRELMETLQHYWGVNRRLREYQSYGYEESKVLGEFIQLLRSGTITANPRPVNPLAGKPGAVSLGNIFQYRSLRTSHRWQFWLDAGSELWDKGGAAQLLGSPVFLKQRPVRPYTIEEGLEDDRGRLHRIVQDLMARASEGLCLCHSELGVNGNQLTGPLLTLIHTCTELVVPKVDKISL